MEKKSGHNADAEREISILSPRSSAIICAWFLLFLLLSALSGNTLDFFAAKQTTVIYKCSTHFAAKRLRSYYSTSPYTLTCTRTRPTDQAHATHMALALTRRDSFVLPRSRISLVSRERTRRARNFFLFVWICLVLYGPMQRLLPQEHCKTYTQSTQSEQIYTQIVRPIKCSIKVPPQRQCKHARRTNLLLTNKFLLFALFACSLAIF